MGKKVRGLWKIKLALTLAGKKMWRILDKASKNVKKAEFDILMDIVAYAKDTVYGREHHFSEIKTIQDFQKCVPVNNYEDLEPFIKRHTRGETDVLFPGKPIMYATTSGTTKEPKWIPITEKYNKETYNGLSRIWLYSILKENPDVFDGPEFSIVGKAVEGYTEDGSCYGSFSGHVYENIPGFLKVLHVLPTEVYGITDYSSRYYVLLRMTIEHSIHLLITGNPSTLLEMNNVVQKNLESFIRDIETGTLKKDLAIDPAIRQNIEAYLSPNPERAAGLQALKEKYDIVYPKHYWPELKVIVTWKLGNSGLYLQHTRGFFPRYTRIREFGYIATEARAGLVLDSDNDTSILVSHLLFFEFIKAADYGKPDARVYLSSEIEDGEQYYIIVTTPSGLYRYNMNDIVQVEGFYNQFPRIRFIQKGHGVTSLTGEKVHEAQFLKAIHKAEKELSINTMFHIGFADFGTSAYHLFAEFSKEISDQDLARFAETVDSHLRTINMEYESKRGSNRIRPLIAARLKKNSFDEFKALMMARGYRDGQFKLTHLMVDEMRMNMFKELTLS